MKPTTCIFCRIISLLYTVSIKTPPTSPRSPNETLAQSSAKVQQIRAHDTKFRKRSRSQQNAADLQQRGRIAKPQIPSQSCRSQVQPPRQASTNSSRPPPQSPSSSTLKPDCFPICLRPLPCRICAHPFIAEAGNQNRRQTGKLSQPRCQTLLKQVSVSSSRPAVSLRSSAPSCRSRALNPRPPSHDANA